MKTGIAFYPYGRFDDRNCYIKNTKKYYLRTIVFPAMCTVQGHSKQSVRTAIFF